MSVDSTQLPDSATGFAFGEYELDTHRGSLRHGDRDVKLRPKSFDLLAYLVANPGRLISKDELLNRIWGTTVVTDDAVTQCVIDIRRALNDREQAMLKTVPRRGFIFDVAVVPIGSVAEGVSQAASRSGSRVAGVSLGLIALLALLVIGWQLGVSPDAEDETIATPAINAQRLSIAVLPLEDMSEDQDQAYFAEGISEELLNLLTRVPELSVIARTSSFSFRGQNADIQTIAERLGVTHVLEGSVRKSTATIRVTIQLVRTIDSAHVWSETYERKPSDIFALQDEISADVVERLQVSLLPSVVSRRTPNPDAYRLYMQAVHLSDKLDSSNHAEVSAFLEEALKLDPDFGAAWRELARVIARDIGRRPNIRQDIQANRAALGRALELDPDDAATQAYYAYHIAQYDGELEAAARRFERAIALEPDNEHVLRAASLFAMAFTDPQDAVALGEFGISRNPLCYGCVRNLGFALRGAGRLREAQEMLLKSHTLFGRGAAQAAKIMLVRGNAADALATFRLSPSESMRHWGEALALNDLGRPADAAMTVVEAELDDLDPWLGAQFYAWLGSNDRAFDYLEMAAIDTQHTMDGEIVKQRPIITALNVKDPIFRKLHDDPRWQQFLHRYTASPEQLAEVKFSPSLPTRP